MCGIVGLHCKSPELHSQLGVLLSQMLLAMSERGPDSAGIALYEEGLPTGSLRYSLRAPGPGYDWEGTSERLGEEAVIRPVADDAILTATGSPAAVLEKLAAQAPDLRVFAYGSAMEVYKDIGAPVDILERYGIAQRSGYQGLGHTRMATESAVTTDHSHPFATAADLCLVHNGSFSNHATIRRRLEDAGVRCSTDNDSEVAARFIAYHMQHGDDLQAALGKVLVEFDGFFTLLVASRNQFAVVRDAFACKPAVIAEAPDFVAMASEYRALARLPGIQEADIFEPGPEEIHVWSR